MSETQSHKNSKGKAAGKRGQTEVPLSRGRRLDALSSDGKTATEVERSGSRAGLEKASARLKAAGVRKKVLKVPNRDVPKAMHTMNRLRVAGAVSNLGGTRKKQARKAQTRKRVSKRP
jgi:hypothetical protein